uniref:BTB domain-containing protein n=1 Tax=Panagrolaimus superbus TaxID=310955 RepID=A0A914YZP8_9BILA
MFCKPADFFDSKNNFFVNGEITVKIEGILKTERSLIQVNQREIEAVYDFSVDSVNFSYGYQNTFKTCNQGYGIALCSTDELFDPLKGYFVDGFLTINLNGILLVETNENIALNAKDFTIVVGGGKVHKDVLMKVSPVMVALFESGMKESDENKMDIEDFPFEIVDEAVNLCYNSDVLPNFVLEDKILLYRFADKYEIKSYMAIEKDLIKKLTPSNVVQLIHFSKAFQPKLHQSCIDFLLKCAEKHIPVLGIESLGEHFLAMRFLEILRPVDFDLVDSDEKSSDAEESDE